MLAVKNGEKKPGKSTNCATVRTVYTVSCVIFGVSTLC